MLDVMNCKNHKNWGICKRHCCDLQHTMAHVLDTQKEISSAFQKCVIQPTSVVRTLANNREKLHLTYTINNATVSVLGLLCPYKYIGKRSCLHIPLLCPTQHCPLSESKKPPSSTGKPHCTFITPTENTSRSYITKPHFKCIPK